MTAEARREAGEWYGALVAAKDEIANLKAEIERLWTRTTSAILDVKTTPTRELQQFGIDEVLARRIAVWAVERIETALEVRE